MNSRGRRKLIWPLLRCTDKEGPTSRVKYPGLCQHSIGTYVCQKNGTRVRARALLPEPEPRARWSTEPEPMLPEPTLSARTSTPAPATALNAGATANYAPKSPRVANSMACPPIPKGGSYTTIPSAHASPRVDMHCFVHRGSVKGEDFLSL